VDGQRLADRQHVAVVRDGADRDAQVDGVGGAGTGAGEGGIAGDAVVPELVGVDGQAVSGQGDVAEAGVAGEGDDVVAGVDLGVAAEVVIVGDGGGVRAAA